MEKSALTEMPALPGLDCGLCGFRTCADMEVRARVDASVLRRCIYLPEDQAVMAAQPRPACGSCAGSCPSPQRETPWQDALSRDFDFYLEHFPEDPGPREMIIPHNPMLTRELDVQKGDVLIGRPLGMSCGCPITHCGIVQEADHRTGVITWCVTGPLASREGGFKDLGYFIAEAYEGLVRETRVDIRIGARHFFQPRMCMLQWRHSALINYVNRTGDGIQVRLEGLWIG
jgi:uncharacterized Fe-S cluster-containing protein